jgi:hypothetical protein
MRVFNDFSHVPFSRISFLDKFLLFSDLSLWIIFTLPETKIVPNILGFEVKFKFLGELFSILLYVITSHGGVPSLNVICLLNYFLASDSCRLEILQFYI